MVRYVSQTSPASPTARCYTDHVPPLLHSRVIQATFAGAVFTNNWYCGKHLVAVEAPAVLASRHIKLVIRVKFPFFVLFSLLDCGLFVFGSGKCHHWRGAIMACKRTLWTWTGLDNRSRLPLTYF